MTSSRSTNPSIWLAITAVVAAAALYGGAVIFVNKQERAVEVQALELATEMRRNDSMHDVDTLLDDVAPMATPLENFFASPDDVVSVIERIEDIATDTGAAVSVGQVRLDDADALGQGTLAVEVLASGTWKQVARTLVVLDSFPLASSLASASLTSVDGDDGDAWTLRAGMLITLKR